jgi:aryl-alcohol dehydrogenase-like predicted oxidoreductase
MKLRNLGKTELIVSELGIGTWAMGSDWGEQPVEQSVEAIHRAIAMGCRFIDTAAGYGNGRSEQVVARALQQYKGGETIRVATKIHPVMPGHWPPSPYCKVEERYPIAYLQNSLDERLKNLKTDCIDLIQLHTWTRAWNRNPLPLLWLAEQKKAGKVRAIGISTPEHDQNAVNDLMKAGLIDAVQVIFNLFEQEPAAELLPLALEHGIGVIVRVALDESALAGRFSPDRVFAPGDFRNRYFEGDRKQRTANRINRIENLLQGSPYSLREAALRFVLDHPAVSTVITGVRDAAQAEQNMAAAAIPPLPEILHQQLRQFNWPKGFWYSGK